MDTRPIPAFYCCYLLRSTHHHSKLYIGSTPAPRRRLAQHNGDVKGGAVRTSQKDLRPWEMTCVVAGFPSNIAALQFEWAWQNPHLTRHIPHHERISLISTGVKSSAESGKSRRAPARPKLSLKEKLSNLHLLLRVPYFSKWPLELRFFSEDVYQFWHSWCQRVDQQIPFGTKVWLDKPRQGNKPDPRANTDEIGQVGVNGVDVTYSSLRSQLEKSQCLLEENGDLACGLCKQKLQPRKDFITVCPHTNCESCHHITCLSHHLLQFDLTSSIVPVGGKCPGCKNHLVWAELMKAMTLRVRGAMTMRKVLKGGKRSALLEAAEDEILDVDDLDDLDSDQPDQTSLTAADFVDEADFGSGMDVDGDGDDNFSVTSAGADVSHLSTRRKAFPTTAETNLATVIEDSDDEALDLVDDWTSSDR